MSLEATGSQVSYSEYRSKVEALLRTRPDAHDDEYRHTPLNTSLDAARVLLAYSYGLAHDELTDATLTSIEQRCEALLEGLDDGSEYARRQLSLSSSSKETATWTWIESVYSPPSADDEGAAGRSSDSLADQLQDLAEQSPAFGDLIYEGKHIRSSLHPFNLYRHVFHNFSSEATMRLLQILQTAHVQHTRNLLQLGAPFISPQWCLLTATDRKTQRAELEQLQANLLDRALSESTPPRARLRLMSQVLVLCPPNQIAELLPQWTLVSDEVEEVLEGADPYVDAATAASDAARGFRSGLGLSALPSIDIGGLSSGVKSWGASVGRLVSGAWR
ncbi:hypothetical protein OC846_001877 [Tilletia horrida]|uniref:Uncharacterized protein n=1 Tax=Tilletia horrida TaxID=155126 RepID=A0AAN6GVN3_9BASI|nr:hypothetical protein OC846_001877 [Tilletia horrida]KAK0568394.1 hypothetical protein OC861_002023 [Tilletia horrida]